MRAASGNSFSAWIDRPIVTAMMFVLIVVSYVAGMWLLSNALDLANDIPSTAKQACAADGTSAR